MRSSHRNVAIALLIGSTFLTACGSRRPLSDFVAQAALPGGATQAPGTAVGTDPNAPAGGPGATGAPLPGQTAGGSLPGATGAPTTGPGASGAPAPGTTGAANGPNLASDIGVTATSINLGNVTTKSGGFGEDQFTPFYYGAAAYFDDLNAHGGLHGRKITFNFCDDGGDAAGNNDCIRKFIDNQKIFAFVANTCLACDGLKYASQKAVPMVGGVAIDFKDYAYPHAFRYSGNPYPQNGSVGWKGKLYEPSGQYTYFKQKYGVTKAGVVYYDNSASSKGQGLAVAASLRSVGIQVTEYPQNVALPNYDSAVVDMKSRGIQAVWDAIDIGGNQNLCKSIDANGLKLTAKVSTISVWSQSVGTQFHAPCRNYIFSVEDPGVLSYDQTSDPEIAKFRAAMQTYFPDRESKLFQWSVDGWASAMWFTDAALSCGANLTRACLEKYLYDDKGYSAHGLWQTSTHSMHKINFDTQKSERRCIQVDRWSDPAKSFVQVGNWRTTCYDNPYVAVTAPV